MQYAVFTRGGSQVTDSFPTRDEAQRAIDEARPLIRQGLTAAGAEVRPVNRDTERG